MILTPQEIRDRCIAKANKGLLAMAYEYQGLVRRTLSVPAPRRRVVAGPYAGSDLRYYSGTPRRPGDIYYVATTRATPGAPPRKLSGHLRRSIAVDASRFNGPENVIRVGTNVPYGKTLEEGTHKYLWPTLTANLQSLQIVAGTAIEVKGS